MIDVLRFVVALAADVVRRRAGLVADGYDGSAQPLLFVPEWTEAGLAMSEIGLPIDEDRLTRLALLKVAEGSREIRTLQ